uniref:Uncharacterized protein n=1 Tax=Entomoneis paludosa TaxID=265537 RepID=A0A7S2YC34_9STRA|mmetsp:Transcript_26664/g.55826  ORF Transcript_26664/g.55826 Transcript_26664/m.55826 type:complete len:334 (+) Transcript_26664:323-1324(+)
MTSLVQLVMYSGKIGLVLDAKTTDGNLFRQVGSTTLMSSSVNELTAKHVYDNLETTSLEVLADLDCGSEGSFTLKAEKFQANAVEFGLVRQGHAVTHVTVEKLAWLNDQGYKPTLSSNPVCSPIEAPAQDPILNSSPDCNWHNANDPTKGNQNQNCFCAANHNPGSPDQTHSCSNPEYPICVGHVPGKSWGTCFQDTTQRNPDNAVCSKDSDCTDSNYSACKYGRCYVDLDSMCTASNPMFDVTMWGDSLAFNVFWDPLPTCTGTVTIHADTFSQSSSYESGQATLILTSSDGSATLTDATATAGNVNDLVVTSNGHAIAKRSKFGDIVVEYV